jgi:basic membrane protein A
MSTRRRTAALLSTVAAFALVGAACGSSKKSSSTTAAPAATTAAPTQTTAGSTSTSAGGGGTCNGSGKTIGLLYDITGRGDKSFNDAAAAGLDKAKTDCGVTGVESTPTGDADRAERIKLMTDQKIPLIIGVGFLWGDQVTASAKANPSLNFGIVDSVVSEPNTVSMLFAANESSYLVGMAAALKSKTHHIGFIGGQQIDLIKNFEVGYDAGAKAADPSITIDSKYLGPAGDNTAFNNPAKAKETALAMYQGGADVVYHAAGASGVGLFQAAKDYSTQNNTKVWGIGVDSDQYQTVPDLNAYILTSALKKVDVAVYDVIRDFVQGNFKGTVETFNLKTDGVGYATSGGYIDDIKDKLEQAKADIISGKITVPSVG